METVDLYNNRKELLNETCNRNEVPFNKYRLSIHVWIVNDNNEVLIQQRSENRSIFPNMWTNTGGAALAGESSIDTVLRELHEELNIIPMKEELTFIASYIRKSDYVDVWVLHSNVNIKDLKLQKEEVQDAKWVSIEDIKNMIENNTFVKSSFDYFNAYLKNVI